MANILPSLPTFRLSKGGRISVFVPMFRTHEPLLMVNLDTRSQVRSMTSSGYHAASRISARFPFMISALLNVYALFKGIKGRIIPYFSGIHVNARHKETSRDSDIPSIMIFV